MIEASVEDRSARARRLIFAGVVINILLAGAKLAGGLMGGSKALVADALESTLDIFSSGMMWAALKVAARPADDTHPYGHGKVESLAAAAGAMVLLLAGSLLAFQSLRAIWKLNTGSSGSPPEAYTLGILIVAIVCKEVLFRLSSHTAHGIQSTALKADAWHHRSDALTSLAALVGISLALLGGPSSIQADAWAALLCCGVILWNGGLMLRSSLGELLDEQMPQDVIRAVERAACSVEGVTSVEKCRVRKSGLTRIADIHVRVAGESSVTEGHAIAHGVKAAISGAGVNVSDVTVHIEPEPHSSISQNPPRG